MHKLVIHNLGPIKDCTLNCTQFMAFTGFQSSGKSTIAKAIFYFRTIKDDILSIIEDASIAQSSPIPSKPKSTLHKDLTDSLREKFLRVFGSSWGMDNDMFIEYHYTSDCFVKVSLKDAPNFATPNYIYITLSDSVRNFLRNQTLTKDALGMSTAQRLQAKNELNVLFDDIFETVYIPAGRSMITLLSSQMNYIYTMLKDAQKRTIDYCTQDYIERILRLKSEFSDGLDHLAAYEGWKNDVPKKKITLALNLIRNVLKGNYVFTNGEERIALDEKKYVKINFASSGQQESVWILNLLFYYLVCNARVNFIIEEPESHLFPESQKYITELIALLFNANNSIIITTHSPYVLGTLNNLLYADEIGKLNSGKAKSIIPSDYWIDYNRFSSWFVKNGGIENCMDEDMRQIHNERIDDISKTINEDYDKLFDLSLQAKEV